MMRLSVLIRVLAALALSLPPLPALAQTPTPLSRAIANSPIATNPVTSADSVPVLEGGLLKHALGNQFPGGLPYVANNTALQALPSTTYPVIVRDGYATAGDAPPLAYVSSSSACSLNSGAGDGGSQVASADSKCWLAKFSAAGADVREWGATTSADASAAINTAILATSTANLPLLFPGGTYPVCAASIAPQYNTVLRGELQAVIQTQPACAGPAATQLVLFPNDSLSFGTIVNSRAGSISDLTFDGYGLSKWIWNIQQIVDWRFHNVLLRNTAASTVTTAATNATTASGNAILHFASCPGAAVAGNVIDDLTRPGVIPPGTTVSSCTSGNMTVSANVSAHDDGTGVGSGDTIRFMVPTAGIYAQGGDQIDFRGIRIENINDTGHTLYTSQTTMPMACIYVIAMADSDFSSMKCVNAMYGAIEAIGGNIFGPDSHVWGEPPAARPFDLRPQYGWAVGGGAQITNADCDDCQIASVYMANSSLSGVPGTQVNGLLVQHNQMPGSSWSSAYGVLLASGVDFGQVRGVQAFQLSFNGAKANIVYQRGVPAYRMVVGPNADAYYTTIGQVFEGASINAAGNQTVYLGPTGFNTGVVNFWTMRNSCYVTGFYVAVTNAPGAGQSYIFTVYVGGLTTITATISGASTFSTGSPTPPANTQIAASPVFSGTPNAVAIQDVASSGAGATNLSYRIYTNCQGQ